MGLAMFPVGELVVVRPWEVVVRQPWRLLVGQTFAGHGMSQEESEEAGLQLMVGCCNSSWYSDKQLM